MEDIQLLDINDPRDVYALHFVFISIIQKHLDLLRRGWSQHSLRTEHNKTPCQLWITELQDDDEVINGLSVSYSLHVGQYFTYAIKS